MENSSAVELKTSPMKMVPSVPFKSPEKSMSNIMRPPSSHLMKVSEIKSKQQFLLEFKEWRKVKREQIAKSLPDKLKKTPGSDKSSNTLTQAPKIKSNIMKPLESEPDKNKRESVFERLYKNEKVTRKSAIPTLIVSGTPTIVRNKTYLAQSNVLSEKDSVNDSAGENAENLKASTLIKPTNTNGNSENALQEGSETMKEQEEKEEMIEEVAKVTNSCETQDHEDNTNEVDDLAQQEIDNYKKTLQIPGSEETQNNENQTNEAILHSVEIDKTIPLVGHCGSLLKSDVKEDYTNTMIASKKPKVQNFSVPKKNSMLPIVKGNHSSQICAKPGLRRSISMLHRKKKVLFRTPSEKNLHELKNLSENRDLSMCVSSAKVGNQKEKPSAKLEQMFSPRLKKAKTTSWLRQNLENWLKTNGHSLESYRHLRCFGIEKPTLGSAFQSKPIQTEKTPLDSTSRMNKEDKENVAPVAPPDMNEPEQWLQELYNLIVELKFPLERCEEWLSTIRKKCPTCIELPIYWECLSAFKNDNANVDHRKVEQVNDAMVEMFDKMAIENQKPSTSKIKLEQGMNPDNIIQSTVVKFAVQPTKAAKEYDQENPRPKHLVATPVRRSSRIKTPSKGTFDSLRGLSHDISDKVTFKTNKSLLNRF